MYKWSFSSHKYNGTSRILTRDHGPWDWGDCPLSSVITSEFAATKLRGTMIAAVFATQALGQFIASVVALIVTTAFRNTQLSQTSNAQKNYCNGSRCYYPSPSSVLAADRM
jgi:MFS family permease